MLEMRDAPYNKKTVFVFEKLFKLALSLECLSKYIN